MNRLSKVFCIIIAILIIALAVVSYKYITVRKEFISLGEELMEEVEKQE